MMDERLVQPCVDLNEISKVDGVSTSKTCEETIDEHPNQDDYNDVGEFFFESDHLALKVNADYQNALQTMAILEAQRIQVIKDLDQLRALKSEALTFPIAFVQKVQRKENLNFPKPLCVRNLPQIDWTRYITNGSSESFGNRPRLSTNKPLFTDGFGPCAENQDNQTDPEQTLVRGRVFDKNKPATFNQLWSTEEQKRLEELLVIYPPEETESRRWAKIAAELGNRTPTQVASRVQKYFIKLSKAGIPIPGRPVSGKLKSTQNYVNLKKRLGKLCVGKSRNLAQLQTSTFFRHKFPTFFNLGENNFDVPSISTFNPENDDGSRRISSFASTSSFLAEKERTDFLDESNDSEEDDQDAVLENTKNDPEMQELLYLKKLRESKLETQGLSQHVGFRCVRCNCSPIIGTRWHCVDCPPNHSTDFCNDCVDCPHETELHNENHSITQIKHAESAKPFLDRDYVHFMGGDYNYLDPNYMPAT